VYSNMRMIAEEVYVRLFVGEAPPKEQLYPLLMLIKKMKSEDMRMCFEISHSSMYTGVVERRFERCYREGRFKDEKEVQEISDIYYQIVGKQIRRKPK